MLLITLGIVAAVVLWLLIDRHLERGIDGHIEQGRRDVMGDD